MYTVKSALYLRIRENPSYFFAYAYTEDVVAIYIIFTSYILFPEKKNQFS